MIRPGDIIDGKYEVVRLVGEGGMSRVWLARDFFLDKVWAVKEVDKAAAGTRPLEVSCLVDEALLLKELDHPALPRVVEVLETADAVLLVMDYVRGKPLSEVLVERGGKVSEGEAVGWGLSLCEVLGYLHSRTPPVIYRDMKPSNVMLCEDGALRLIDFGIARAEQDAATGALPLGTRAYAAPEQFDAPDACDERSDLYALGRTLERLAGIDGTQDAEGGVSEGFAAVLRKATAREPRDRYQNATEMAAALRQCGAATCGGRTKEGQGEGPVPGERAFAVPRGRRRVLWLVGAACVALGCLWVVPRLGGAASEEASYASLMEEAGQASRQEAEGRESEAERCCRQAVELRPDRPEPYEVLLREVYLDDARFSLAESSRWEELAQAHAEQLRGQESYPEICYEAGMLYYAFGEDEQQVQEAARGAWWFESCERALASRKGGQADAEQAARAHAYGVICGFYRDLVVAREDAHESETYRTYWDALEQLMGSLGAEGSGDVGPRDALEQQQDGLVRLRLCELVRAALESPVHVAGFAQAGVTYDRVDALWNGALSLSEQAQTASGLSNAEEAGWKEVREATPRVRRSEAAVYGARASAS